MFTVIASAIANSTSSQSVLGIMLSVAVLVAVAALIIVNMKKRKSNPRRLEALAESRGLNYAGSASSPNLTGGPILLSTYGGVSDVIWGEMGDWLALSFLYSWQDESTRDKRQIHTVVSGLFVGDGIPDMSVYPEEALTVDRNDLQLESHAFNEKYRVSWTEKEPAISVLDARMMEFMVHNPGAWWLENGWLYTYKRVFSQQQYETASGEGISYLTQVAGHFPAWVVRSHGLTFSAASTDGSEVRRIFPALI